MTRADDSSFLSQSPGSYKTAGVSPERYAAAFDRAIADACTQGFDGNPETIRPIFDRKLTEAVELAEDFAADNKQFGLALLRAIAEACGTCTDPIFPREIQRLWETAFCVEHVSMVHHSSQHAAASDASHVGVVDE